MGDGDNNACGSETRSVQSRSLLSDYFFAVYKLLFLALLRTHFKMRLSRAKNIFTPANINSIVIIKLAKINRKKTYQKSP